MAADTTVTAFDEAPLQANRIKAGKGSGIGDYIIRWYPRGNSNITKLGTMGKYVLGIPDGKVNINHTIEAKEIETGVSGKVIGVVKTGEKVELALSFMGLSAKGEERVMGSNIPVLVAYPSTPINTDIDTTTLDADFDYLPLTAVTGLKENQRIEVVVGDPAGDFGTQKEYVYIDTIDTTAKTVTVTPALSQLPVDGNAVKVVKSLTYTAGGNKLPDTFALQIIDQDNSTGSICLYDFPECQIKSISPVGKDNKAERKGGFTVVVIPQRQTYVDSAGATKTGYIAYTKDELPLQ
jgi:hypothetical protein